MEENNIKFTVINDAKHEFELEIEFSAKERENRAECLMDVALGCSRVILAMIKDCSSEEKAKKLAGVLINQIQQSVDSCIEDHFAEKKSNDLEKSLYELMENAFYDWLGQVGVDENDFIRKYSECDLKLDFSIENGTIDIFFNVDNKKQLEIMSFSMALINEDEKRFEARCNTSEFIAVVALDKLYGEENNPLRIDYVSNAFADKIKNGIE